MGLYGNLAERCFKQFESYKLNKIRIHFEQI